MYFSPTAPIVVTSDSWYVETVTVGGLSVPHQEFGVVDNAAWNGDRYTSGLLGLGFPNLTSVFTGDDPLKDSFSTNTEPYDPFFFTAVKQNLVQQSCGLPLTLFADCSARLSSTH